jgi:hypothetical protein
MNWVCWRMAHRTVRCTRTVQVSTNHSRENEGALRYNSPDYPVCHRTVQWASGATAICAQRSTLTAGTVSYNAATEVRATKSEGTRLSGVAPDCPVPQENKARTVDSAPNPNGWVTWQRTEQRTVPVRWRTGLSGAPFAIGLPNGYGSGWRL